MIKHEDILNEVLQIFTDKDLGLLFLQPLFTSNTPEDFYQHFTSISQMSPQQIGQRPYTFSSQMDLVLNQKLKRYLSWEELDFQMLIKFAKYLHKTLKFKLDFQILPKGFPNIFQLIDALQSSNNYLSIERPLTKQLWKNNQDALYKEDANQQTYSYKCLQKMNQQERQIFEIVSVNKKQYKDQQLDQKLFEKYISTHSPKIFFLLLDNRNKGRKQVIKQIVELRLNKNEEKWQLLGECRVNKACLTPENLNKALLKHRQICQVLAQDLCISTEDGFVFKYDIFTLFAQLKQVYEFQMEEKQYRRVLQLLITNTIKLVNSVLADTPFFIFKTNTIEHIPKQDREKLLDYLVQLIIYGLKAYFMYHAKKTLKEEELLRIPIEQLKPTLCQHIRGLVQGEMAINLSYLNTICALFRWVDEPKNNEVSFNQLFSDEGDQDNNLNILYLRLLKKIVNFDSRYRCEFTNFNCWNLRFFTLPSQKQETIGEDYNIFINYLYQVFINQAQIVPTRRELTYKPGQKCKPKQIEEMLIKMHPLIIKTGQAQWINDFQQFKSQSQRISGRGYRLMKLLTIFISEEFKTNESLNQRLRNFTTTISYQLFYSTHEYKKIWQPFLTKIDLDGQSLISHYLAELQSLIENDQLIATNCTDFSSAYKEEMVEPISSFVKNIIRLSIFVNTVPPNSDQIAKLEYLVFRMQIMKVKYISARNITIQSLPNELLDNYFEVYLKGCFPAFIYDRFNSTLEYIIQVLNQSGLKQNNKAIIFMLRYLVVIIENHTNISIIKYCFDIIVDSLKGRSRQSKCNLFQQFYLIHRQLIVRILQKVITFYQLDFKTKKYPYTTQDLLVFAYETKKQGKIYTQQKLKTDRLALEQNMLTFIKSLFKQTWYSQTECFLLGDLLYDNVKQAEFIFKSVQIDLINTIVNNYSQKWVRIYNILFRIIGLNTIQETSVQDCIFQTKKAEEIGQISGTCLIFNNVNDIRANICKLNQQLMKKMFLSYQQEVDLQQVRILYNTVRKTMKGEQIQRLQSEVFQSLILKMGDSILLPNSQWKGFYNINCLTDVILQDYDQPIGHMLSKQFLQAYIKQVLRGIKDNSFVSLAPLPLISFIQRLMPYAPPKQFDAQFKKSINTFISIINCLITHLKVKDAISITQRWMKRLINIKDWGYLQEHNQKCLLKNMITIDGFSQYFCNFFKKQLDTSSIQLEIKCYFLKQSQKNPQLYSKGVKLETFIGTFSEKHVYRKQSFKQVAERILRKTTIKQGNKTVAYVHPKENQLFDKCSLHNVSFSSLSLSQNIKKIISQYIDTINTIDLQNSPQDLVSVLNQLKTIIYYYPILTAFILMHPYRMGDQIMPFIDYVYGVFTTVTLDEEAFDFFAYISIDLTLILKFQEQPFFFSEYLCYHLMTKVLTGQMTKGVLLFVFYMMKIKRFADLYFQKIDGGISLCQRIWVTLRQCRKDFTFENHNNVILYSILSMAYRERSFGSMNSSLQHITDSRQATITDFVNECWFPFKNMKIKEHIEIQGQAIVKSCIQLKNKDSYIHFQETYASWYEKQGEETEVEEKELQFNLKQLDMQIGNDYVKYIGVKFEPSLQKIHGITSDISTSYTQRHTELFNALHLYLFNQSQTNTITNRKKRRLGQTYHLYEKVQQQQPQAQTKINEALQTTLNRNYQSRFALSQHHLSNNQAASKAKQESFSLNLQQHHIQYINSDAINEDHKQQELSPELIYFIKTINQKLAHLSKPQLILSDIDGNTLQQQLQFLKLKNLQTDFDQKQATMNVEQFEEYCLINVSKLERINTKRKDTVRNIEDAALLKFVQRSTSCDSVGYIIDTIDENYQYFSKRSQPKDQKDHADEIGARDTRILSSIIPDQAFEDITDDNLYELILSAYCNCKLVPTDYMAPFLENRRVQAKIVSALLYISQNPYSNDHFPNVLWTYDLLKKEWAQSSAEPSDAKQQIHQKILKILQSGNASYYFEQNYLSKKIVKDTIYTIHYSPKHTLQIEGITYYQPIQEIMDLLADNSIENCTLDECQQRFRLFRGLQTISQDHLQKMLNLLSRVQQIVMIASVDQQDIYSDEVDNRISERKSLNLQQNIYPLLRQENVKQQVRKQFPIESVERDPFFVCLLINSEVYSKQELLKYHKSIIVKDEIKSGSLLLANHCFKFYTDQQLKQCTWIKESKNIVPALIRLLPKNNQTLLKMQPFYNLFKFPHLTTLKFKTQMLSRRVYDYQLQFQFKGDKEFVADRKHGIFQSAFSTLKSRSIAFWYEEFKVKFKSQLGVVESGYGDGVGKDWYSLVTKGMVNLNYALFSKTSKNYYFFNRESWINPRHLQYFEFIGKLFACAVIQGEYFLTPSFSIVLYKMIFGEEILIEDVIAEFDEGQMIKNVEKLRDFEDDSMIYDTFVYEDRHLVSQKDVKSLLRRKSKQAEGTNHNSNLYLIKETIEVQIEKLSQTSIAEISEKDVMQKKQESIPEEPISSAIKIVTVGQAIELVPGGSNIPVTIQNREQFIALTKKKAIQIIVEQARPQFNAFMEGFSSIVKPQFLQGISAQDLREIAEGCDKISIEELKEHASIDTDLKGSPHLEWFWECLEGFPLEDRAFLIQHWTGLPKIPAEGFKGMKLRIVQGRYGKRLFAQTCFNKLHLPKFSSKQQTKDAIETAIALVKKGDSIIED